MFDAMRQVNRPDQLDYSRVSTIQNVAWKTGTSYGARDGWAIGITPGYVVGVWVGNADGSGVADLTGARTAGPVMFDIFNLLPQSGWFAKPQGSMQRVCSKSGHLAGKYCEETEMRLVPANALKSQTCPYCHEIPVSIDGLRRVADCSEPMEMKSFFMLPPLQKHFFKQQHADYIDPPVDNVAADKMKYIYPHDGTVMSLPKGESGILVCKATHADASAMLFWHLDNDFIEATTDIHQIQIKPTPGSHRLTIVDNSGSTSTLQFTVK